MSIFSRTSFRYPNLNSIFLEADDAKTTVRLCVSTLNDHEFKQSIRPQNLNGNNMGCESRIDLIKDYDFFHKSTSRTTFENLESQLKTEHGIQKIFGAFSTDKNGQAINTNFHFNRSIYKEMALSAILTENHPDILIVLEKNSNEHALEEIRKKKAESV
ncbi:hypothetical protein DdX_10671 [Ditylenchus destructor]|uniref:Uncharacterized protein n=1 Tax=Ditylenchus destructor TaxID=166010 RepID=A0AAD4N0V3_9BILA|nr:hypothetical protein DdX_10671 [Ditylenchus destructor]